MTGTVGGPPSPAHRRHRAAYRTDKPMLLSLIFPVYFLVLLTVLTNWAHKQW